MSGKEGRRCREKCRPDCLDAVIPLGANYTTESRGAVLLGKELLFVRKEALDFGIKGHVLKWQVKGDLLAQHVTGLQLPSLYSQTGAFQSSTDCRGECQPHSSCHPLSQAANYKRSVGTWLTLCPAADHHTTLQAAQ